MGDRAVSVKLKKEWTRSKSDLSLREFARKLVKEGQTWVEAWFENKKGVCEQARKPENVTRANLERLATKQARKKTKTGAKKTETPAT